MVRLARFERATYCLGGSCSIQLSYNRMYTFYHEGKHLSNPPRKKFFPT